MLQRMGAVDQSPRNQTGRANAKLGWAWLLLCIAFFLHVVDETATHFLSVYNPTVVALREKLGWFPMPTFEFDEWFIGLVVVNVVLLSLSPLAFRGIRWLRPAAYVLAIVMLLNAMGHTAGTIAGRTVASVHFQRPMPGFYSSPGLFATSIYMLYCLRKPRY
jgi:hypothetical protein